MNKIKFSHLYSKLRGIDLSKPVKLIRIELIDDIRDLGDEFIEYDTSYWEEGEKHYYPLKKNLKYIVLYFVDAWGLLFTTIRRYTPAKSCYYQRNYNDYFHIKIK